MRYTLFILLWAFCATVIGQNADNKVNSNGKKQGFWKKYDESGRLLYEGNFQNGVPVGQFKYYHTNGKLKSTTNFIQGTHKVYTVMYDESEKKAAEGIFVDQQKDSVWNYYNPKGTLIKTESYKKGKRNGLWRTYSSQTGILLEECTYLDDKLNGSFKTFYADGKISGRIDYINGQMNGTVEAYFPNEKIYYRGTYLEGLQIKNWDYYDESGRKRKTLEYNHGVLQKTYLYLKMAGAIQQFNQADIAYFHKEGNSTRVTLKSGKSFLSAEIFDELLTVLDFVDFCLINPQYAVSYPCIIKYREIDSDSIEVVLYPQTAEPVICEGDHAKSVKMLFNNEIPKEE
ncbi:MAG: toxin-antitoxin system YwqK family antitoxin [Bacteroidales bacterium]|nr:toxin-antitoxin system YwqK family antitoxin [Bacteroidales bacterium]